MRISALAATIVLAWLAIVNTATAAIVTGSFAGIAHDALLFGNGTAVPTFDGASVQGTFRIDTGLVGTPTDQDVDFANYRLTGDALLLRFTVGGTTYSFGDQGLASAATVFTGQGGQALLFGANFLDVGFPTALLLFGDALPAGASGLYVDGLDLATLRPAPIPLDTAMVGFQLTQDVGAMLALTALRFDDPQPVPEPAGWVLLLTGLALAGRRYAVASVQAKRGASRRSTALACTTAPS